MTNVNVNLELLEKKEKEIKKASDLRTNALAKKELYEEQIKESAKAFEEFGTSFEDAPKRVEEIQLAIDKKYQELENLIPTEMLKELNLI